MLVEIFLVLNSVPAQLLETGNIIFGRLKQLRNRFFLPLFFFLSCLQCFKELLLYSDYFVSLLIR